MAENFYRENEINCHAMKSDRNGSAKELPYHYKMSHPEKSICLLFNMETFESSLSLSTRDGTSKDEKSLKCTFKGLGFQVRILKNLTYLEIKTVLETVHTRNGALKLGLLTNMLEFFFPLRYPNVGLAVAAEDHSQRNCLVCVVLSHGDENGLFAKDGKFTLQWLVEFFNEDNCKSLVGKPKLFFIQACRGNVYDDGIETDSECSGNTAMKMSLNKDYLYSYATPPGYFAWRNNVTGSWFIQSLCQMLKEHGKNLELIQILTRVNNKVALEYETWKGKKEMPYFVSMLTKELYLVP